MTKNFSNATNVYNNNAISQFPDSNNIIITRGYFRQYGENGCLPLIRSTELQFLCTALLLSEIYPSIK